MVPTSQVLLISSSSRILETLKNILRTIDSIRISSTKSLHCAKEKIKTDKYNIVFIDELVREQNRGEYYKLFQKRIPNKTSYVVLMDNNSLDNIMSYLEYDADYLLDKPLNINYTTAITNKILGKINQRNTEVVSFHNLHLYPQENYLLFKYHKIYLTNIEKHILYVLLKNKGMCNTKLFIEYFSYTQQKVLSYEYFSVIISRLRKKIFQSTGLNLIKNRYATCYYISI